MSVTSFKKFAAFALVVGACTLGAIAPAEARDEWRGGTTYDRSGYVRVQPDRYNDHRRYNDNRRNEDRQWNRGHDRYYYPPVVYHRPPPVVVYRNPPPRVIYAPQPYYYPRSSSSVFFFNY